MELVLVDVGVICLMERLVRLYGELNPQTPRPGRMRMMPAISAKLVSSPLRRACGDCGREIDACTQHITTFGRAEPQDKPYQIRLCIPCALGSKDKHIQKIAMKWMMNDT